jgi:hypothetical protein
LFADFVSFLCVRFSFVRFVSISSSSFFYFGLINVVFYVVVLCCVVLCCVAYVSLDLFWFH